MSDGGVCYAIPISLSELASPLLPGGSGSSGGGGNGWSSSRDTQLFFGCCCDMRRAVVIVNILSFLYSIFLTVTLIILASAHNHHHHGYNAGTIFLAIMMAILCLSFPVVGMIGAMKFNKYLVMVAAGWYATVAIMLFITWTGGNLISGLVVLLLYVYPHGVLSYELHTEVMTEDNYSAIEHSCCCV